MNESIKTVIMDASSAILLFKAGIFDVVSTAYRVVLSRRVFEEITRAGYDGAREFICCRSGGKLEISFDYKCCLPDLPLRGGERESVMLYLSGAGDFIIIDDRRGARYCRGNRIPYVNALLMSRILFQGGFLDESRFRTSFEQLLRSGRYASWVADYAAACPSSDLEFFVVSNHTRT